MHDEFNELPFIEMLAGKERLKTKCPEEDGIKYSAPRYQCAIDQFYERTSTLGDQDKRLERNRIQEHVLAISDDRCNAYKRFLRYDQSMSRFWLGVGSTLAGGLGALASTLTAAKTFAATGGVLSGISAEYNQDFYGNLFYSVVSKAIDEQRRDAYRQIQTYGQSKNLTDYPVEAALKDAIAYDGMCSAVSAMQYAEKAVQLVNDPGMDGMMRFLVKANQTRVILQNSVTNADELKKFGVSTIEDARFGSRLNSQTQTNPQATIQTQLEIANQLTVDEILIAFDRKYAKEASLNEANQKNWKESKQRQKLANTIRERIKDIVDAFNETIYECSVPASKLHDQYLVSENALLTRGSDSYEPELQITRDQLRNKLEQLNSEVLGISSHLRSLLGDLSKAALQLVPKQQPTPETKIGELTWKYQDEKVIKFDKQACQRYQ